MKQQIGIMAFGIAVILSLAIAVSAADPAAATADAAAPQTVKATFLVTGLHCPPCTSTVEKSLKSIPGVRSAKVDWATKNAKVEFDEQQITAQQLSTRISQTRHMMGGTMQYGGWLALKVPDIAADGNGDKVKEALAKVKGVDKVSIYPTQKSVGVSFTADGKVTSTQLIDAVKTTGLEASVFP